MYWLSCIKNVGILVAMYSWEIQNILQSTNYNIDSTTYIYSNSSPQITRIKYNSYDDCFEIWTNTNHWLFSVYKKKEGSKTI